MNAFQYLDIYFQKASIKNSENYTLATDGQAKAAYSLLSWLRVYYKWIAVPQVIGGYILVKAGLKPVPVSPLIPKEAPKLQAVQTPEGNQAHGDDTPKAQA